MTSLARSAARVAPTSTVMTLRVADTRGVGELGSISLTELVARADLQTRLDRKYLLDAEALDRLLERLPGDARVLEIDGRRSFGYRSVYLDTPELEAYHGSAYGRRRRYKVRLRSYLDSGLDVVEVKTRGPRGATVKDRTTWTTNGPRGAARDLLDSEPRAFVDQVLHGAGIGPRARTLQPVLVTTYERTTVHLARTDSRVTIDTALGWRTPGGRAVRLPELAIVETKTPGAAGEVDRLLWSMHHRPSRISKYGTGLAALHPSLPSHRWRPVLRRWFTDTPSQEISS